MNGAQRVPFYALRGELLWEKELILDMPNPRADFSLSNTNSRKFPAGDYKIDIYLNDALIDTVHYKVQ